MLDLQIYEASKTPCFPLLRALSRINLLRRYEQIIKDDIARPTLRILTARALQEKPDDKMVQKIVAILRDTDIRFKVSSNLKLLKLLKVKLGSA